MNSSITPRLEYIDLENDKLVLANFLEDLSERLADIAAEPEKSPQIGYSFLFDNYKDIAAFRYALGYPLSEVHHAFVQAIQAYLKVLELRGTQESFPLFELVYDPAYPPDSPESLVEFKRVERGKDYSLGNSWKTYQVACLALALDKQSSAQEIASLIWDPPEASYVGPRSFCTPNGQHLAYAFRGLLSGSSELIEAELKQVQVQKKEAMLFYQKKMIRALGNGDAQLFIEGVSLLLEAHKKKARRNKESDEYLCVPGLGLCRLALQQGLCELDELPQKNVHLPLELLATASG